MLTVRELESRDVEAVVWLGAALKNEAPEYRDMHFSREKTEEFVSQAADKDVDYITGWVAVNETGNIVGFILAYTSTHMFFDDIVSWDGTLYLQPNYRGGHGTTVAELIDNYVDWAGQWGGPIKFGLTTNIETGRLERMFHRRGFDTTGRILTYVRQ